MSFNQQHGPESNNFYGKAQFQEGAQSWAMGGLKLDPTRTRRVRIFNMASSELPSSSGWGGKCVPLQILWIASAVMKASCAENTFPAPESVQPFCSESEMLHFRLNASSISATVFPLIFNLVWLSILCIISDLKVLI